MKRVLITGSDGFVGRNLQVLLQRRKDLDVRTVDLKNAEELEVEAGNADVVFHLAGVNRPVDPAEFRVGNAELTQSLAEAAARGGRRPTVVVSSSTQAQLGNAYGNSKLASEEALATAAARDELRVRIFRLPNVFGKWSRPNYNSAVATFCYNIARGVPIHVEERDRIIRLVYIDEVVAEFSRALDEPPGSSIEMASVDPVFEVTLGEIADRLGAYKASRNDLMIPVVNDELGRRLYATYLSFLPTNEFDYGLPMRTDDRGSLAEFMKSPYAGQVFVSSTHPGVTRGNHFHDTKVEKFLVLSGTARITFRSVLDDHVFAYDVSGADFRVVDIPPGYTHAITNVGDTELVTLFWASETFSPDAPDTYTSLVES